MTTRQSPRQHPYYPRWKQMNHRCINPSNKDYPAYGGRGIRICDRWHQDNPNGFYNFLVWLETKLKRVPDAENFVVGRKDVKKGFNPRNCEIQTRITSNQHKRHTRLTKEVVIEVRKLLKEQPDLLVKDLQDRYGFGTVAMWSSALLGRSWVNVNKIEAPIEPRPAFRGLHYARQARCPVEVITN
jgi:hypothetical protein